MGTIVTIMALLTGFFTQQIVLFQDCLEINNADSVSISKTNNCTQSGVWHDGVFQEELLSTDYGPMVDAINVGIIQPVKDYTNILSRGCSSGNCTFPSTNGASFSTLGVCHICENITAQIRVLSETTQSRSNTTKVLATLGLDYEQSRDIESMTFLRQNTGEFMKTWTGPRIDTINTIYFVYRGFGSPLGPKAVNCTLFPTVNTYTARIESATLKEDLVDSVRLFPLSSQFPLETSSDTDFRSDIKMWYTKMAMEHALRDGKKESCTGSENPRPGLVELIKSTRNRTSEHSADQKLGSAEWTWWYFPEDCIWSIHTASVGGMQDTFRQIFDDRILGMFEKGGLSGPIYLQRLYKDGKVMLDTLNEQMKSLTPAMTAVIRTNGDEGPSWCPKGEVWANTTCLYIRWPWISFPAVMIGLTGIFLLLVVTANRGIESDRLWKSSFR